jgi:predicted RNase H-like HicB family nuclease
MKNYRFSVIIEKDQDGYFASCPEFQGCYTQGETYEEVWKISGTPSASILRID